MTSYRKPDGKETQSPQVYVRAWHKLTDRLLKLFPGYELACYDPDITLQKTILIDGPDGGRFSRSITRVSLSLVVANDLLNAVDNIKGER